MRLWSWMDVDGDDGEAIVEVLAEMAFAHSFFEIAVRGGDDANVDVDVADAADAANDLIFHDAEKLGLEEGREFADLVEEERAAVGDLEKALLHGLGVGEGSLFMAEEFGFDEGFGNRRAVDGDEGAVVAGAFVVENLGDEVLAGTALALDEDGGGLAGGDLTNKTHQLGGFLRSADDLVGAGLAAHLAAEGFDLATEAVGFEGVLDGDAEFVEIERLADEIVSAHSDGCLDVVELRIAGHHDDDARLDGRFHLFEHFEPADIGQADVEQHDVGSLGLGDRERLGAVLGLEDGVVPFLALLPEAPADEPFVVNDQDFDLCHVV